MNRLDTGWERKHTPFDIAANNDGLALDERYELFGGPLPEHTPKWKKALTVFAFTSLWWTCAIIIILVIKKTVSPEGIFPYPFAFTSMAQPTTGLMAFLLSRVALRGRPPSPSFRWDEVALLIAVGIAQGFEIAFTNKALGYLSVAGRTMISSTNVFFMMITARLWGLERLGYPRIVSAMLLITGGVVQGLDQQKAGATSQLVGQVMQVASMLLSAQRWALAQYVMHRLPQESALGQMLKLELLAYTLPITGVVCIPLALTYEAQPYTLDNLLHAKLFAHIFIVGAGLTCMLFAELKLVDHLSAVAFNVLSTVHAIPIVLIGVVIRHEHVHLQSAAGFGFCVIGALVYVAARQADQVKRPRAMTSPARGAHSEGFLFSRTKSLPSRPRE